MIRNKVKKILNQYLNRFKGKSSQKVYKSEIIQFFNFYKGDLSGLNKSIFIRYRDHLGQGAKAKTVKRKFSILNQFFKHIETRVKGFKSPIGKSYGDMQVFQGNVYVDTDAFKTNIERWQEVLVCESTKKTYAGHVRLFFDWVKKEPKDLTLDNFIQYRDYLLKEKKLKASTIWNKFIAINGFLKIIDAGNRKFKNPLDFRRLSLVPPKKDKGYYTVLSEKEVKKLLNQPDRRSLIGKRNYAILRLMMTYGLRVGEICKLRYQDLEGERVKGQQKVWIRDRKGRSGRRADTAIILNGKALIAFDDWMDSSGIHFEPDTPIFVGFIWHMGSGGLVVDRRKVREKKQLSTDALENVVEKYVKQAGINHGDKVISPHALRHTALTMLARAGIKLVDLKYLAGHQDVGTTMIYLHSVQTYDDHVGMHNPINV